jgi:arsenite methyltransferase
VNRTAGAPYQSPLFRQVTGPTLRPGGLALTDRALGLCGFKPGDMVADLGCGPGSSAAHLASMHGMQVFAIDLSQEMLAEADAAHQGLTYIQANAQAIPLADACLDGVLCECVLSLTETPQMVLRECRRVLKPGGRLMLTDLYLRNPPAGGHSLSLNGCVKGASSKAEIETTINNAGMELVLWEDHSRLLSRLAAQLVWEHGSAAGLWGVCSDGDGCSTAAMIRQAKPGYFLLAARRKVDGLG